MMNIRMFSEESFWWSSQDKNYTFREKNNLLVTPKVVENNSLHFTAALDVTARMDLIGTLV